MELIQVGSLYHLSTAKSDPRAAQKPFLIERMEGFLQILENEVVLF